ncbi:MAG: dihydroorotate dehydrogenase-like protein [Proteobacteria bacterium]|nr:dihydroorotate dehydrogenase-like protein [Pseudomonadota bacterium]
MDLSTRYLGLELKNPLVAGASPLTGHITQLKALERAGVAAVVLPSLFEEQIDHDELELARLRDFGADGSAEAANYFPELTSYRTGPDAYLAHLEEAKRELSIPVIGSLNGVSSGGWVRYAKLFEEAGADAVELNIYYMVADPLLGAEAVEQRYLELVQQVRAAISIPLAVKIGPYFTALAQMAQRLREAGADGLVLFNRFMQPDIDLESLEVRPGVELSTSAELLLPLRWIAILKGRVALSLAATTGVHTANDVIKLLLAGADVTMLASALLRNGPAYPRKLLEALQSWLEQHEYTSVEQLKGSMSQLHCPDPTQFERANYMKALLSYSSTF